MWNPRVSLGFGIASDVFGAFEVSLFSYGRTKGDMDWRLLSLGLGTNDDDNYFYIAPIEYNIGKPLPFMPCKGKLNFFKVDYAFDTK